MPCRYVHLPGGGYAIVCGRGQHSKPCDICHRPGGKLCDYPLRGAKQSKTCDRSLCAACAVHVEPDTDYCPSHARMVEAEELEAREEAAREDAEQQETGAQRCPPRA